MGPVEAGAGQQNRGGLSRQGIRQQARSTYNPRPMIKQLATVSAGTLASRLLGFIRDTLVASLLGAGPVADAFLFAFQLINVARRLVSEGAFNAMLVPAY